MHTQLPDTLCYLNGEYQPLNEAKVSVLDRGFIFGDGIYEVVPVYGKKLFRFDEHMAPARPQPRQAAHRQPAQPRPVARALQEAHRMRSPSAAARPTSSSTSR